MHSKPATSGSHLPARDFCQLAAAGLIYLGLSVLFFGAVGDYGHMYLGYGLDPVQFIWFLNWWPWAIAHWLNPFISYYVWYPHGFNLTWATSIPSAALLMWPLTWIGGAVVSYNVLSLVAPALSAWTAFLLARNLTRDTPASFIGGYLFGFSSYELGELLGHLNLDMIFMVPLVVLLVVKRVRGDLTRPWFVGALALAMLVQLGFSSEILATTCFFGAVTWAIFLAFTPEDERRRLWTVAREIFLAAGIMIVVASPFLYFLMQNRADVPSQIHDPAAFSNDPLNYLLPYAIFPGRTLFWTNPLPALHPYRDNAGYDAYLGLPLILILILQLRELRRRPYLKPLLFTLLAIVILSLGPALHVAGVSTSLWLPWRVGVHLPLIGQALPNRFSMYVALAAGLTAALWLGVARSRRERIGRYALAALACLCLLPDPAMVRHWTPLPSEPFFEPQNIAVSIEKDANVLILPYAGPSLLWQLQSGMRFTQSGGYVGFTPQSEALTWPVLENLYSGTTGSLFENDLSGFCLVHHVSAILIGPDTPPALVAAISALHWQETNAHGVDVVRVPDAGSMHFHHIWGDYWPQDGWMGRQVNIFTHGQPIELRITGQYRPAKLGPVQIRATVNGSELASYRIGRPDTQVLSVPANASVTLTASATFIPKKLPRNADERNLSVVLGVEPEAGSSAK
jgi:hypothetical protein